MSFVVLKVYEKNILGIKIGTNQKWEEHGNKSEGVYRKGCPKIKVEEKSSTG